MELPLPMRWKRTVWDWKRSMNKSGDCVGCGGYYRKVLSADELCSSGYHRGGTLARPIWMCLNWASDARQSFDLPSLLCSNGDDELFTRARAHTHGGTNTQQRKAATRSRSGLKASWRQKVQSAALSYSAENVCFLFFFKSSAEMFCSHHCR